jgi:fumarate reductase subunit C
LFVLAVSVHAPIGVRNVLKEWTTWRGRSLEIAMLVLAAALLVSGLRALWAVVA